MGIKVRCDYCGHETPHTKRGEATEEEELEFNDEYGPSLTINWNTLLLQCDVCNNVSLHYFSPDIGEEDITQLFPIVKDLSGVPTDVVNSYSEAKKVKNISPLAFVTLIRRSLEYVCMEKGAVGKDLNDKLKDLGKKEIIPQTLSKMSHVIRILGNIGAHADNTEIGKDEARIIDDFFVAVLEYVYIAPEKIKKVEKYLKK